MNCMILPYLFLILYSIHVQRVEPSVGFSKFLLVGCSVHSARAAGPTCTPHQTRGRAWHHASLRGAACPPGLWPPMLPLLGASRPGSRAASPGFSDSKAIRASRPSVREAITPTPSQRDESGPEKNHTPLRLSYPGAATPQAPPLPRPGPSTRAELCAPAGEQTAWVSEPPVGSLARGGRRKPRQSPRRIRPVPCCLRGWLRGVLLQ